jgi:hypothetical protein
MQDVIGFPVEVWYHTFYRKNERMILLREQIYNRELRAAELASAAMHVFAATFGSFVKVLLFIFLPISLLETVILQRMAQMQGMMLHIDGSMAPT